MQNKLKHSKIIKDIACISASVKKKYMFMVFHSVLLNSTSIIYLMIMQFNAITCLLVVLIKINHGHEGLDAAMATYRPIRFSKLCRVVYFFCLLNLAVWYVCGVFSFFNFFF